VEAGEEGRSLKNYLVIPRIYIRHALAPVSLSWVQQPDERSASVIVFTDRMARLQGTTALSRLMP